ncbi:uncharacterized protein LOC107820942 isoform X2 [Nicotiana tabacum]|uniref:uncharacterized protein LOC107820942 isoform X2 n=1 Tax=Nicotiana tabacum TaxID=4097 RepID=UPI003F4E556F
MMRSLSSRVSKRILSSAMPCYGNASSFFMVSRQPYRSSTLRQIVYKSQRNAIPCDFLKWGSLGSIRTSKFASGFSPLKPKPLDSIIDMERAKNKSAEELADVWDDYHLGRGHIAASMKAKLYKLFEQRSATDILLFRCGGEVVTQPCLCKAPHVLITGLEDYKARGTQASPYFTVSYYTEFAESKDLVLVRGDIVFTSKLTDSEAKWLLDTAQSFYLNDVRYKLVERFNRETREFEFKDVLQTLEMPIL